MSTCSILFLAALITATPPLQFDKAQLECGEVRATKPLVQRLQLKNTSNQVLTITEVVGSCGCVRRDLEARELAPGASTTLTLAVNLLTVPEGANNWRVTVRYRIGENIGEQSAQLSAKVVKDIAVEPVALFVTCVKDASALITVTDRRAKPMKIIGVRTGVKNVGGTVGPANDNSGQRTQQVTLAVPESCPTGTHVDEVYLETDDPDCPELRIPLRIVKKTPEEGVVAFPANAVVRFAKEQETASALLRLRDADGKEVVVESIEADHEAITSKWVPGPGTMATVRLNVDRAKLIGSGGTIVTVRIRSPKKESILIPISWLLP